MSNDTKYIEFGFQRNTPVHELEKQLGRPPNDDEISRAKRRLFAVDDVFCTECETLFGKIEEPFCQSILPNLRETDLEEEPSITFQDVRLVRLFFLLQFWRAGACADKFSLSNESYESLRTFILNYDNVSIDELKKFPLSITYLNTLGGNKSYTENLVGYTSDQNPYIIYINDFVIQLYDSSELIKYLPVHNLNDQDSYKDFINIDEEEVIVRIFSNEKRKIFNLSLMAESKGKNLLGALRESVALFYQNFYRRPPTVKEEQDFIKYMASEEIGIINRYDHETLLEKSMEYFRKMM